MLNCRGGDGGALAGELSEVSRIMLLDRREIIAGVAVALAQPAAALPIRIKAISWRGRARVFQSDTILDLTIDTRIEPFRHARSKSWITSKGEASARTLVIEPTDGWLEQGSQRKSLPPTLIAHERQQYGLYGYLLRATQTWSRQHTVKMTEPGFPSICIKLTDGRVTAADYTVSSSENSSPLAQHFVFDGSIDRTDLRWFRHMTVFQAGQRYFELTMSDLIVEYD